MQMEDVAAKSARIKKRLRNELRKVRHIAGASQHWLYLPPAIRAQFSVIDSLPTTNLTSN